MSPDLRQCTHDVSHLDIIADTATHVAPTTLPNRSIACKKQHITSIRSWQTQVKDFINDTKIKGVLQLIDKDN